MALCEYVYLFIYLFIYKITELYFLDGTHMMFCTSDSHGRIIREAGEAEASGPGP